MIPVSEWSMDDSSANYYSGSSSSSSSQMSITMPRGDIRAVYFTVYNNSNGNGEKTVYDEGFDEIYFTVKTGYNKAEYLFQKRLSTGDIELMEDGVYQFVIEPEDTDNLKFGAYVFDIELVAGTDIKQTFTGSLTLTNEATHASNEA